MAQFSFRLLVTPFLLALVAGLAGCGDDDPRRLKAPDGRALGRVVGWVTLDGQPLAGAQIDFNNKMSRTCSAGTDENGYYKLKFNRRIAGAPVGEHSVSIGLFGNNSEDPTDEPLPSIYNTKSILKTTVHEGHNVISFHLTTPKGIGEVAELAEVTGLVLLNGNPLVGAKIEFQAERSGTARGVTDPNGRYQLVFTETRPGAVVGPNRVVISRTDADGEETIRKVYNVSSTLHHFVKPGENDFNFSLSSKLPSSKDKPPAKPPANPKPSGDGC